ncbi:mannosyltransferase family protein [Patulibacter americanus]|uniref:mannosyltransferase family protein n=1 Tax=Patulibacter americanus TaxID=588672 RepID=UPI00146ECABE|nr:mannosyltransferase family protein [Patulibacter americanus]
MNDPSARTASRAGRGVVAEALGPEWALALREAASAFLLSRAVVWIAGVLAIVLFGWAESRGARLDPLWACRPTGTAGVDALVAPGCRWDSTWYLEIAGGGYSPTDPARSAFFPLYPLLVSVVSAPLGGALLPAGLLVSWSCALGFLTLLHHTVARARGAATASTVVKVAAYVPPAIFLSAVYTEALFLLLSLGALVAARRDRWMLAGILGAIGASCRSIGILIAIPLAVEYLWGRRGRGETRLVDRWWRPRHALRPDVLWIGLVPLGFLAYAAFLGVATGDPMGAVRAQGDWERHFLTPIGGLLAAVGVVVGRIGDLAGLWYMAPLAPGQVPALALTRDVVLLLFVGAALAVLWWGRGRVPVSWWIWGVVSLAYPLSVPSFQQPLMSLPRFTMACFPIVVMLGLWAHRGGAKRWRWLAPTLLGLQAAWAVLFVTWTWAP